MRHSSNKPIVPITLKKEIAVPQFTVSDARLGRANRSGRRGASYGDIVGLENSESALASRAMATVYGGVQSVMAAKYKKDQKEKEDLITINQIQDGIQKRFDDQAEAIKALQKAAMMPTMARLAEDVLTNPDITVYSEDIDAIFNAYEEGDAKEVEILITELSKLIPDAAEQPLPIKYTPINWDDLSDDQIQEGIESGWLKPDGTPQDPAPELDPAYVIDPATGLTPENISPMSVFPSLPSSFFPTPGETAPDTEKPTRYSNYWAAMEVSAENYNKMSDKERFKWRNSSYQNKIEYYHPDKGWLGYMSTGWTKARWRKTK